MAAGMTAADAARATGHKAWFIREWAKSRDQAWRCGRTTPVCKDGQHWPSIRAAAADLGVTAGTLERHLARYGHLERVGKPAGLPKGQAPAWRCKPVTLGNRTWPSMGALARHLGISRFQLQRRLNHDPGSLVGMLMVRDAPEAKAALKARLRDAEMVDRVNTRWAA